MIRLCMLGCLLALSGELQFSSAADTVALESDAESDAQKLERLVSLPLLREATPDYTCPGPGDTTKKLNDFHLRGTALGGWLVLEPWITPSLFYQFLGASNRFGDDAKNHVGLDSFTFCTALGKKEANRQLRAHWDAWVTEDQIRQLAKSGVVHLRIPVADWMFVPYEPFIGCWDGALEQLDRVLGLCHRYGIKALLDVHAVRGSQNGLDNSGDTSHYRWVGNYSHDGAAMYDHWDIRGADWLGPFSAVTGTYDSVNDSHVIDTIKVVNIIVDRYKHNPVVMGIEPLNEPWAMIPLDVLQEFYWRCYQIVQLKAPHWLSLFHDSFRLTPDSFGSFLKGCDNWALDTHIYQAWAWENTPEWFALHACMDKERLVEMEALGVPIIVGEWSLATDNCAMWLNGLNDNVPGYPKVACEMVRCADPYFGPGVVPNAPPDPTLPAQDPVGMGGPSTVEYGMCPRDAPFPREKQDVRTLAYAKLHAFDYSTHGQFFWNFRTELETRWDFFRAVDLGWIPTDMDSPTRWHEIAHSCDAIMAQGDVDFSGPAPALGPQSFLPTLLLPSLLVCAGLVAAWALLALKRKLLPTSSNHAYQQIATRDVEMSRI